MAEQDADAHDDVREDEADDQTDEQADDQTEGDGADVAEDDGDEAEGRAGDPAGEAEPDRQSRGSERIRNQARLNAEARERAEAAERRAAEAERRAIEAEARIREREQARTDAEERDAMAAMSDTERTQYLLAKELKGLKNGQQRSDLYAADARDSAKFSAYLSRETRFNKYADRVEQLASEAVNKGQFVSRDLILNQLIAQDVRNSKAADTQRSAAKKRVDNARGRASGTRSDAGSARRGGKGSLVERMERDDMAI